ncbi:uncharacterized protein L3040_001100 [Drepanopeziza brunnea f. sp. 'multigermtubi']|nr:hypothetical protein L3040_001100 [Drepanopeziza brunnea f. sp. 'multigermtubi']
MGLAIKRNLLAFPPGDNSSDTLVNGVHFDLTTLQHWNYTYYSNQTFSNGSLCCLVFEPYTPHLLHNGTFLNSTTCYSAVRPMEARAKTGLLFACLFALSIVFTLNNLRKHGRLFLPMEKRFRAVGRRWQWYWMLFVAGCALVSCIANVDVDRYYLPELPIVLSSLFWFLMLPTTMCMVWESVRHWGSWQERQMVDPNPFLLRQDDRRSTTDFWLPLLFYCCVWMNFFMAVPRSWTPIEFQRDPEQQHSEAEPLATDTRFKLAAFLLLGSWLTTVFSLWHSINHYKPRKQGIVNRGLSIFRYTPFKFLLTLPLSLVMIGYEIVCAFDFAISPLKVGSHTAYMYGLGWAPIAATILVYEVAGYLDPNEDRELIRQRRIRAAQIDAEVGITKKPRWWSRLHGDNRAVNVQDAVARNVAEIGGGRATMANVQINLELGNMPVSQRQGSSKASGDSEAVRAAANLPFLFRSGMVETQDRFTDQPDLTRERSSGEVSNATVTANDGGGRAGTGVSSTATAPSQQIRSMLDV